jgi:hypothetical protein
MQAGIRGAKIEPYLTSRILKRQQKIGYSLDLAWNEREPYEFVLVQ